MNDELHNSSVGRYKLNDFASRLSRLADNAGLEGCIKPIRRRPTQLGVCPDDEESSAGGGSALRPSTVVTPVMSDKDFKVLLNIVRQQQGVSASCRCVVPVTLYLLLLQLFESLGKTLQQDLTKVKRLQQFTENQSASSIHNPGLSFSDNQQLAPSSFDATASFSSPQAPSMHKRF